MTNETITFTIKWAHRLPATLAEERENGKGWEYKLHTQQEVPLALRITADCPEMGILLEVTDNRYGTFFTEDGGVEDYGPFDFMIDAPCRPSRRADDPVTWEKKGAAYRARWDGNSAYDSRGALVSMELLELVVPTKREWRLEIPKRLVDLKPGEDPTFTSIMVDEAVVKREVRYVNFLDLEWLAAPLPFKGRARRRAPAACVRQP